MTDRYKFSRLFRLAAWIIILTLLNTACSEKGSSAQDVTVTATARQAQTSTSEPTPTLQATAEVTPPLPAIPLPSSTPIASKQPTKAPSIESISPISATVPITPSTAIISFDNIGQLREIAKFGQGQTWEVRLSTDGTLVFVASGAGITVYDAFSQQMKAFVPVIADCEIQMASEVHSIVPGVDGQKVMACSGQELMAYGLDGKPLWTYPLPKTPEDTKGKPTPVKMVISPDLNFLVLPSATRAQEFEVWEPASNKLVLNGRGTNPIFTPDSSNLGVDFNGNVWLYSTRDWSKRESIGIHQGWEKLFLPDGDHLALLQPERIDIYRLSNGKLERTFLEYRTATHPGLFVSPDGTKIAWAGREYPDKPLKVWSIPDGKRIATSWRTNSIWSAWPQEFTRLANDGRAIVNEFAEALQEKKNASLLPAGFLGCILRNGSQAQCTLPPGNNYYDLSGTIFSLVQIAPNEPYRVFNGPKASGTLLGAVTLEKTRRYLPLALTPDQGYLLISTYPDERNASFSSYRLELWGLKAGVRLNQWSGHLENVAFSSDGRYAAILLGKYSGRNLHRLVLFVYDFTKRAIVYQQDITVSTGFEPTGLAFIPQGELVFTQQTTRGGKEMILLKFYDTEKWQPWREIPISDFGILGTKSANRLPALAASPDGKLLAVALADHRVRLYNLSNGNELYTWTPHQSQTSSLRFSTDGRLLGTLSSQDGFARFWAVTP